MSQSWPLMTIAECASDEPYSTQIGPFGKALTPAEYTDSGVPLLRGVNVNHGRFHDDDFVFISEETANRLAKFESFPGDVLLVHKGTLGKIGLMPDDRRFHRYIMGNSMLRVRCNRSVLIPEYLYYWLSSADGTHYLLSRVSQVGVPQIQQPLTTLRQATLPVPSLVEQQAIAHILGTLDDKIDLNRRMNATLEAMARALFQAWFVDFEPVRAKQKAWRFERLGDVAAINARSIKGEYLHANIEYIDISAVTEGRLAGTTPYRLDDAPSRAQRLVQQGDTIWSCVRPNRRSYLFIHEPVANLVVSTGFAVLSPQKVTPSYLHAWVTTDEFVEYLTNNADGSAYPAVRPPDFARAEILVPDSETLHRFEKIVGPMRRLIAHDERESRTLSQLRDTLLPKLMSGEVRVPDGERIVERAV